MTIDSTGNALRCYAPHVGFSLSSSSVIAGRLRLMVASVTFRSKEKGEKSETNHYSHGKIYIWGSIQYIYTCVYGYIYMYLLGPVYLYIYICIYIYMCMYIYIYVCVCKRIWETLNIYLYKRIWETFNIYLYWNRDSSCSTYVLHMLETRLRHFAKGTFTGSPAIEWQQKSGAGTIYNPIYNHLKSLWKHLQPSKPI